jgi:hypothetical protein
MPEGANQFPLLSAVAMVLDLFKGAVPHVAPGRRTVRINTGKGTLMANTLMANDAGACARKASHRCGRSAGHHRLPLGRVSV